MTLAAARRSWAEVLLAIAAALLVSMPVAMLVLALRVSPGRPVAAPGVAGAPMVSTDEPARPIEPPTPGAVPAVQLPDAVAELQQRNLLVPVTGVTRADLRDTFADARDRTREHEALDVLAPRGTPVVAVDSGTIVKLFTSIRGGLTIYQFDPTRTDAYYYAHLDGYEPTLKEHDLVQRGRVIGFVGTTGNAPKNTPHLHFAIFVLTQERQWWRGTAINPFDVWGK